MIKDINVNDHLYIIDTLKDQLIKRGVIDIYDLSYKPDDWFVLNEYIFWSARLQRPFIVPKWMITNLSSIPKRLRWLISVNERHRIPSILHDYLYRFSDELGVSKESADLVFKDFMVLYGVPEVKIDAIYYAVKLLGNKSFVRNTNKYVCDAHKYYYSQMHKGAL